MVRIGTSLRKFWLVFVLGVAAAGLSVFAQTPAAPPDEAPVPAAQGGGGRGAGRGVVAPGAQGAGGQGAAGAQGAGGRGAATQEPLRKDPVLPLSPAEEATHFWLQPGYKMEPVLTDPDIQEPAQIAFDGNGRMYVLEIRGYMQTSDGDGELLPVGQISWHEDRNNDGIYETHGVFVDKLIFPRFVMPLGGNAILTKESNADEVWKFTDTNGDGVADKKELFADGFGRLANVEHQESGLMWAMDNWMYSTINQVRLRLTPSGTVIREPIGSNGAQWGVTQDNYGKLWFQAGASGMPGYFQYPVEYGSFDDQQARFEPNLNVIWGAPVLIADMQGGPNAVRMPDGSLNRATAGAGNDVYRGDHLPKDLIGDYFYGEVVGRVVRRLHPVVTEGFTQLRNVYPLSDFIRSTDPLFRPVDMTTAPDGTMYITDIYRGIVQESQWSGPGTYLRGRIDQYGLDKVIKHGRIWRLTYEGMGRNTTQPHMLSETPAQLVTHLTDPNGWWRDQAQQLLVLKQDKSVVPALQALVKGTNQLARIQAMWTLEGLNAADPVMLRAAMKDADPKVRQAAIRVSESNYKAGDKSFANDYKAMAKDADVDTRIQAVMTLNTLKVAGATEVIKAAAEADKGKGMTVVTTAILNPNAGAGRGGGVFGGGPAAFTTAEQAVVDRGNQTYTELCFSCHGTDGRGEPLDGGAPGATKAPPLAGSPRVVGHRDYIINVLLYGVTGAIDGKTYSEVMIPMGQQKDEWIADVASTVRNSFGNRTDFITPADVARVRAANASRKTSWNEDELLASLPKQMVIQPNWKVTSSDNPDLAMNALTITPWTSGKPQAAGMWLQLELPAAAKITELTFESAAVAPENVATRAGQPTRTAGGGAPRGGGPAPAPPEPGFPRAYQIQTSMDGVTWSKPVATGTGTGVVTDASFAPVQARFIRITQTGTAANAPMWSVQKLRVFEVTAAK